MTKLAKTKTWLKAPGIRHLLYGEIHLRPLSRYLKGGVNSGKSSFRHNLAQGICSFRAGFDVSWSWHWVAHFLEWGVNSCVPQRKDWISSSRVTWVNFRFLVEILLIPSLVDQSTCPLSLGSSNCKIWTWTIFFKTHLSMIEPVNERKTEYWFRLALAVAIGSDLIEAQANQLTQFTHRGVPQPGKVILQPPILLF